MAFVSSVVAEKTDSLSEVPIEEFGPNGCSKSMEMAHVFLSNKYGDETHFDIPKAYFYGKIKNKTKREDKKDILIFLDTDLVDMSPYCITQNDKDRVTFRLNGATDIGYGNLLEKIYKTKYQLPKDSQYLQYRAFKGTKEDRENTLFIPVGHEEYFIVCKKLDERKERYLSCEMYFLFKSKVLVTAYIEPKYIEKAGEVVNSISQLLNKLIVNSEIEKEN